MKLLRLALLLALGSAGLAAHEAQRVGTDGWCQVASPDFKIISQLSAPDTAEWAGRLNQFLFALKARLPADPRLLGTYSLVLFKSDSDYWSSVPILKSGDPLANVAAFSRSGGWGTIAAADERGSSEDTQRLIYETSVYWLTCADHRYRPRALGTGISEVYGAYVIRDGVEVFGQPIRGATSRLQKAEANSLSNAEVFLKIEDLLSVSDMNPVAEVHGFPMFNLESWGFAHFLMFSKDMAKEHALDRLLNAFAHTRNAHDALREAFGKDADSINSRFRNYIRGGDFYEVTSPVEVPPALATPAPVDRAAVATVLSRLEAAADNLSVARSYAQQALQLDSSTPGPREALALVDFKDHRGDEAEANCKEAIRLGSRDPSTWLEASLEEGRTPANDSVPLEEVALTGDQAREAVNIAEKAIIMHKGLEAAFIRVGALMPKTSRVTDDDGKFLVLGRMLFPNDGWIEIGHAQWAHRVHDDALGLKILDDIVARQAAFAPKEVEQARVLQKGWSAQKS